MPISDQYTRLPLAEIKINRETRQRRVIDPEHGGLLDSVRAHGVFTPIIVTKDLVLVTGERRLEASRQLGLADIPARFLDELNPIETKIIELEENTKRQDLTWQEIVIAVCQTHQLHKQLDPNWSTDKTADSLGYYERRIINKYLKVHEQLGDPRIAGAKTFREAENIISRREDRAQGQALEELLTDLVDEPVEPPAESNSTGGGNANIVTINPSPASIPANPILNLDFVQWASSYSGPRFNLIHCDFPYGINHFEGPQAIRSESQLYDDKPEIYFNLLESLCKNLDKLMSQSGHLMFWFSDRHKTETLQTFHRLAPSLVFSTFPLVWHKSDNAGISPDSRRNPRHIYETCLLATRGLRQLVQIKGDLYSCPTDKRLHPSTKPEPMLRHFMEMLVDETTSMLDPTAGSGAALRAAESLGAKSILGLEIDPQICEQSNQFYRNWRLLRRASA